MANEGGHLSVEGVAALVAQAEAEDRRRLRVERRRIVKLLRAGKGVAAVAREVGVKKELVARLRDFHGIPPLARGEAGRGQSGRPRPRTKQRALVEEALLRNNGNVKRTVRETGIPESTVRRWKAERQPARISLNGFLARTHLDEGSGCLIWDGRRSRQGYGLIDIGGRTQLAHRVAYELAHGVKLQSNQPLHHLCRNRSCVEAGHLLPVAAGGPQGHTALHQLEDAFAETVGEILEATVSATAAPWPAWMDAAGRVGSTEAPEAHEAHAGPS